jgi:hypothetical protein
MKEPLYRWVCTICDTSAAADSAELARLNLDVHLEVVHPSARESVRVRPEAGGEPAAQPDEEGPDGEDGEVRS